MTLSIWGDVSVTQVSLHKAEDLGSIPSTYIKQTNRKQVLLIPRLESRDRETFGAR